MGKFAKSIKSTDVKKIVQPFNLSQNSEEQAFKVVEAIYKILIKNLIILFPKQTV